MRYLRSYQFIFDNPNWLQNVALLALMQLIPVIGPIVALGYGFEVVEAMHRSRDDRKYPDFTFDRFLPYLMRGLWVFLVQLIVMLPFMFLIMILYFAMMFLLVGMAADHGGGGAAWIVVLPVVFVLMSILGFLSAFVTMPLAIRAGLSQDFATAFSWDFIRDFWARMWKELLLSLLFLYVTSIPLMFVGMLLCLVGMYPAIAIFLLAQDHIYYQLYELYLERGGTPIPVKLEEVRPTRRRSPSGSEWDEPDDERFQERNG